MKDKNTHSDNEMLDLMSNIRNQQPILSQGEELLENIVSHLPEKRTTKARIISLNVLKYTASIASIFLIGLFVYLQINDSQSFENISKNKVENIYNESKLPSECNFTPQYAQQHPKEVLLCYLKNNKRKSTVLEQVKNNLNK